MGLARLGNGAAHRDEFVGHAPVDVQVHRHARQAQLVGIVHTFVHQRVAFGQAEPGRRHAVQVAGLAAFVHLRARSLTDDLVDLLIETIHQIGARAERKVERELLEDLKRVSGKQNLLFNLADATLAQPDGVVRDVVFPVVGEQTLRDLLTSSAA